ncbi:MAG: hypothetical protein FWD68_13115 [Alphaproteobacteria bacterium]|nr:hypothetical protein [Alphaproteobacteria bacterium]
MKKVPSSVTSSLLRHLTLALAVISFAGDDKAAAQPASSATLPNQTAGPHHYIVSTLAGGGSLPRSFRPADGSGTEAGFLSPGGIALDAAGNLYVADEIDNTLRKVSPAGVVSTIAGQGFEAPGHEDGDCSHATFQWPRNIAVDKNGSLYVPDWVNSVIRKITFGEAGCQVSTLAVHGDDAGAKTTKFGSLKGLVVDETGTIHVADGASVRRITPDGVLTTIAGSTSGIEDRNGRTLKFADTTSASASFTPLHGITLDAAGNLYVSSRKNRRHRQHRRFRIPAGPRSGQGRQSLCGRHH